MSKDAYGCFFAGKRKSCKAEAKHPSCGHPEQGTTVCKTLCIQLTLHETGLAIGAGEHRPGVVMQ